MKTIFLCLSFAGTVSAVATEVVVVSDSFSRQGRPSTVAAGQSLEGVQVQHGVGTWVVPVAHGPYLLPPYTYNADSTIFSPAGDYITMSPKGAGPTSGNITILDPVTPTTVQADVIVAAGGWTSVGFQWTTDAVAFTAGSLVFANVDANGNWTLFHDQGGLTRLAGGVIAGYVATKPTTVGVQYDPLTRTARVFINGKAASEPVATGLPAATEITSAGFYVYGAKESSQVANFAVTTTR